MRRARDLNRLAERDPEATFGGAGALAFYRRYCQAYPEAAEEGPSAPLHEHKCDDTCPTWSLGSTHVCRISGEIHECDGTQPCRYAVLTPERYICSMTGVCSLLPLDQEEALWTSHHNPDAKRMRMELTPDERSSHGQLDKETNSTSGDIHRVLSIYYDTIAKLLKGEDIEEVRRACKALWRIRPVTGGQKHDAMLIHILTVLHLMTSDLILSDGHVVWRACARLKALLPSRRNWPRYGVVVTSRRVTHREVDLRAAIVDRHLGEDACCDSPCSVVT
jgi:hypothetical protein